ncbi:hypothetical protein [Carboxylicivirga taeanensis]|uniref:hypothetical protein n=1 Tax=Carboxylicivirga taeanensis TaxID=1416875 RepID=UPI003F6DF3FB
MQEIESIDIELKKQFEKLSVITKSIELTEIAQFKIDEASNKIPWKEITHPGIYLLEIKNNRQFESFEEWVENFRAEWENEKYLRKFTPNLKKMRIRAHSELAEWIPLYIGKSKNISGRIHGHIYKELHKTTFALKLMARENLKNELFRLKTIKISVENYDAIIPRIEWQLRNQLNPLIGKQ